MTRILSLDPGHTTGIAILDEDGNLEVAMTVTKDAVYKNGFLNRLVNLSRPDVVLVEDVPNRMVDKTTEQLWFHFTHWFKTAGFEIVDINPSQWKGLVERVEIPGQHARDAATMAKWYVRNQENKVSK